MAARELRYDWFDRICREHGLARVATAHHCDDQVETFFIQLLRRGSIDSLRGIPPITANRIRPLLFTDKRTLAKYAREHDIPYREDSSNLKKDYLRNKIRHDLLPVLKETDVQFPEKILHLMEEVRTVNDMLDRHMLHNEEVIVRKEGKMIYLSIPGIKALEFPELFLSRYLGREGFNASVIADIQESLDAQPGKLFHAPGKSLLKDRNELIISEIDQNESETIQLSKDELLTFSEMGISCAILDRTPSYSPETPDKTAHFDYDKLQERIIFRKWKGGEHFFPLGMKGKKKLSDYYTDQKMSRFEKDQQWIMFSGDEVCWILGRRQDDRFKVEDDTRTILEITLKD